MKKTLLTMLALLCMVTMALGVGTACTSNHGGDTASSSAQVESLQIIGRPTDDTVTLTDAVNTLTLGCDESGITWTSSDAAVATVENGTVALHAAGSTVIKVTKGKKTGEFILTVVDGRIPAPATVTITGMPQNGEVQLTNKSVQLSAICSDDSDVVWISRNEAVATVDETGKVTFLQPGSVDVVAQKKGEASVYGVCTLRIVTSKASYEDFSTAVVIGNYVVGEIEIRDASNVLSPEIVYDETEDNYYLKYSHAKANGNNKYMIYSFGGLETGARYVLKYKMKVLSKEGSYNHQINLYSDKDVPVTVNEPLVGNVYNWHTTGLDTDTAKIYQSGSEALYCDGTRWTSADDSTDGFHEYTLGFIAGEASVGFAFVCNNTYEALFDYICVEKAPVVEEYELTATTRLPVGKTYPLTPVAVEDLIYYQPFKLTYTSSDPTVATVDEKGVVTAIKAGEVTVTATNENGVTKTAEISVIPAVDGENYDIFYEETDPLAEENRLYKEYELKEAVAAGAVQGDSYKVTLEIDAVYYVGNVELYLGLVNASGVLIGHNGWKCETFPASGEKKTVTLEIALPWDSGNFNVSKLQVYLRYGNRYQIGVNVVSVEKAIDPMAANYDLWYVGKTESIAQTYALETPVTGGVRYDTAAVTLSLDLIKGTMPRIKFYLLNTVGAQITDSADSGWINVADCYDETANAYIFTATFKWATGNWDVGSLWLLVEDGSFKLGVDVIGVEIQEVTYPLEYSFTGGSQAQVFAFDKVSGGSQNGYVKVTFEISVFFGTLTNIQFNLCSDTKGETTVANSNKVWNEDGTKLASSGGQISMENCTGKKTVTLVTTFPWASGNWDLQSIRLQLYGTNLKAGVSNIQVTLTTGDYQA